MEFEILVTLARGGGLGEVYGHWSEGGVVMLLTEGWHVNIASPIQTC